MDMARHKKVQRRIGGLETQTDRYLCLNVVQRRIGGLETEHF